jgi:hypothetical protein
MYFGAFITVLGIDHRIRSTVGIEDTEFSASKLGPTVLDSGFHTIEYLERVLIMPIGETAMAPPVVSVYLVEMQLSPLIIMPYEAMTPLPRWAYTDKRFLRTI